MKLIGSSHISQSISSQIETFISKCKFLYATHKSKIYHFFVIYFLLSINLKKSSPIYITKITFKEPTFLLLAPQEGAQCQLAQRAYQHYKLRYWICSYEIYRLITHYSVYLITIRNIHKFKIKLPNATLNCHIHHPFFYISYWVDQFKIVITWLGYIVAFCHLASLEWKLLSCGKSFKFKYIFKFIY